MASVRQNFDFILRAEVEYCLNYMIDLCRKKYKTLENITANMSAEEILRTIHVNCGTALKSSHEHLLRFKTCIEEMDLLNTIQISQPTNDLEQLRSYFLEQLQNTYAQYIDFFQKNQTPHIRNNQNTINFIDLMYKNKKRHIVVKKCDDTDDFFLKMLFFSSIIHEFFVGFACINKIRVQIPNVVYTFGILQDSSNSKLLPIIIQEQAYGDSLQNIINTLNKYEFMEIFFQIFFTLWFSHNECEFVHFDLHLHNIMVQYDKTLMVIDYNVLVGNEEYEFNVRTNFLTKLIDYGMSTVKYNNILCGSYNFRNLYICPDDGYALFGDIFKLLNTCEYVTANQPDPEVNELCKYLLQLLFPNVLITKNNRKLLNFSYNYMTEDRSILDLLILMANDDKILPLMIYSISKESLEQLQISDDEATADYVPTASSIDASRTDYMPTASSIDASRTDYMPTASSIARAETPMANSGQTRSISNLISRWFRR